MRIVTVLCIPESVRSSSFVASDIWWHYYILSVG